MRRPKGFWQNHITSALSHLGGEADLQDITEWIKDKVDFTARELEDSGFEGHPRYVHTIRPALYSMLRQGPLTRVSYGRYRLRG